VRSVLAGLFRVLSAVPKRVWMALIVFTVGVLLIAGFFWMEVGFPTMGLVLCLMAVFSLVPGGFPLSDDINAPLATRGLKVARFFIVAFMILACVAFKAWLAIEYHVR